MTDEAWKTGFACGEVGPVVASMTAGWRGLPTSAFLVGACAGASPWGPPATTRRPECADFVGVAWRFVATLPAERKASGMDFVEACQDALYAEERRLATLSHSAALAGMATGLTLALALMAATTVLTLTDHPLLATSALAAFAASTVGGAWGRATGRSV